MKNPPVSALYLVGSQPLQAGCVGLPVGGPIGGQAPVAVEVYALDRGVTVARERSSLSPTEGAFELEGHGVVFVINPLAARKTHGLVVPVQGNVAPVWQAVEAVDQKGLSKVGVQGNPSQKAVILSMPQGFGKSLIAHAMAQALGLTAVVDEWQPNAPLMLGALHLTSCEVPA